MNNLHTKHGFCTNNNKHNDNDNGNDNDNNNIINIRFLFHTPPPQKQINK